MKIVVYMSMLVAGIVLFACGPAQQNKEELAEEYKQNCLGDTMNMVIYGEDADAYCNCIASQIKVLPDSVEVTDEYIDEVIQNCADEFTSLDTEF
ncbi:MAG: hypothetical protein R6U95_07565 [Bacteroidales bacterium]